MRAVGICMAITILAMGCDQSEKQQKAGGASGTSAIGKAAGEAGKEGAAKGKGFWQPLVWHEFRDNSGTVIASMPFPPDWKVAEKPAQGQASITGPHGIKVSDYPLQTFLFTNDPNLQQIYRQSGQNLRAMPGIDQIIRQDLAPRLEEKGFRYVRHYEVPEVAKVDKWYSAQLYKVAPSQSDIAAIGTEWKTEDGKPYFVLLHLNISTAADMQMWSYYCNSLSSDAGHFEKARKQLLFALGNTHYPLEPIMAYNRREAEKAGRSWAAHNRRMAQNQADFESQQRAFTNRSNAVNEAIMNGYKERDAAGDRMQERTIDGIYERTDVVDPSTGQKHKVAAGANNYWMNSDGEYIGTDQQGYNPNADENMNGQRWQELEKTE